MHKKDKSLWLGITIISIAGLFIFDRDIEKVVFIISSIMIQVLLFVVIDENRYLDTPVELVGKSFFYRNQTFKIVWYFYQHDKELFGVKNLKSKTINTWRKQELYQAIAIDDVEVEREVKYEYKKS